MMIPILMITFFWLIPVIMFKLEIDRIKERLYWLGDEE